MEMYNLAFIEKLTTELMFRFDIKMEMRTGGIKTNIVSPQIGLINGTILVWFYSVEYGEVNIGIEKDDTVETFNYNTSVIVNNSSGVTISTITKINDIIKEAINAIGK